MSVRPQIVKKEAKKRSVGEEELVPRFYFLFFKRPANGSGSTPVAEGEKADGRITGRLRRARGRSDRRDRWQ